jgi:hypothetical protein
VGVALVEIAVDLGLVEALGVSGAAERDVVMLAQKNGM